VVAETLGIHPDVDQSGDLPEPDGRTRGTVASISRQECGVATIAIIPKPCCAVPYG
jgi:hypothetical protein